MKTTDINLRYIREFIKNELNGLYPQREIDSMSNIIIEHLTGIQSHEIYLEPGKKLSADQLVELETIIIELKKYRPLQYILGHTFFFGMKFLVNSDVLIPRPETEELVKWIIDDNPELSSCILDIGTGSGCIAVSLKKQLPGSRVFASDISLPAIKVAAENAAIHDCQVIFLQHDITRPFNTGIIYQSHEKRIHHLKVEPEDCMNLNSEISSSGKNGLTGQRNGVPIQSVYPGIIDHSEFDIIVSNPPYIPENEKKNMSLNVKQYEPGYSLFVPDNDPMFYYRKIAEFAELYLKQNGKIYLEIHEDFGEKVKELLGNFNLRNITFRKDINGKDRMVNCIK